jgi:phage gpG-like protein
MSLKGNKRLSKPVSINQWVRVKSVNIPARPFLRPALEDKGNQQEVLNIFVENINNALKDK